MTNERPWGNGTVKWLRDATPNDADKTIIVPSGKIWYVRAIYIDYIATATAGNRFVRLKVGNGSNNIFVRQMATVTANQYFNGVLNQNVHQGTTAYRDVTDTVNVNVGYQEPLPELILPSGYTIQVVDSGNVDIAADDLTISIEYVEYDA